LGDSPEHFRAERLMPITLGRDAQATKRKARKNIMAQDKFIPNGHLDFVIKAENMARQIAADPAKFEIGPDDAAELSAAVAKYRAAIQAECGGGRSAAALQAKKDARRAAKEIVQRVGNLIRSNPRIDAATKVSIGMRMRQPASKMKMRPVPNEPPRLRFVRAHHERAATPVHELKFCSLDHKAKPPGAVRLELFVALIPPEEPVPTMPGVSHGSWAWYLRSYTRSPIKLVPPIASVPMRVVYWGRWADSLGNVGPFSATAVAWIEGGVHGHLPGAPGTAFGLGAKQVPILDVDQPATVAAERDPKYIIAVLEAKFATLAPQQVPPALPEPVDGEVRQLEGPRESDRESESEAA
jgi:hypothetical protein